MKKKVAKIGIPGRTALVKGADYMANAVKLTSGPFGLNFAIEKNEEITNDGVTIAREIASGAIHDEIEARGARMLLKGIAQVEELVYDGTTSAAILGQATMNECVLLLPDLATINAKNKRKPSEITLQVQKEVEEVVEKLDKLSIKIKDEKTLINSALVSTGNKELAELLGKTQFELGPEGYILAEETPDKFSSVEKIDGIRIDNGIVSSLAINDKEKQALVLKDIPILLTNFIIKDLRPAIANVDKETGIGSGLTNKMSAIGLDRLIIVGRHFEALAINQCMDNTKSGFELYPINAPYVDQVEVMKDLAAVLGGRFINTDTSDLSALQISDLGYVSRLEANRSGAIFCGKKDDKTKARVQVRLQELREQHKGSLSVFEKKLLDQRIAQLQNGFAILKVGHTIEADRKFLKRKADDAVGAVRLALQGGTVEGAGLALKKIAEELPDPYILKNPLMAIYNQIMSLAPEGFKIEKWVRDPFLELKAIIEIMCPLGARIATAGGAICEQIRKPIDELMTQNKPAPQEDII